MTEPDKISRGPIAWMARNGVAANLLMLVLLVGGTIWATRIKQEFFPSFDLDMARVTVPYPGASPEEVEQGLVLAIEEAASGLDGVDEITASATEGVGVITVSALVGADVQKLADDIKGEVDRITTFPEDAEEPHVTIVSRRREVMALALYGDHDERALHDVAERIRDDFLQDPEITQVDLEAVRPLEIAVEVPQAQLRAHGLTLNDIATVLRRSAIEVSGGGVKTDAGEVLVRVRERRDYGREFATLPIVTAPNGTQVTLADIATIKDGFADLDKYATFNGKPVIIMISIPFGIVGAVIGHIIMGYDLSVLSMFGVVALAGVVVNDSLVMIDLANRRRREGASAIDAVIQAGVQRFRPIMLTTLTTFGGLASMIFETSLQARFLITMAISLGYGILFATLITLVLVPALYVIVNDLTCIKERLYP